MHSSMKICHLSPSNISPHIMNLIPNSAVKTDVAVFFLLGDSPASEIQTPGNHPKERIQHSQHGESLKNQAD
jgi:hypothetical protein